MSTRLKLYVTVIGVLAAGWMAFGIPHDLDQRWGHYLAWTLLCLLSEMLWLTPLSGEGMVSMASTANLSTLLLWGPGPSIWINATSVLLAGRLIQKRSWVRTIFNAAQTAVTMAVAGFVMQLLGGPEAGLESAGHLAAGASAALAMAPAFLGSMVAYYVVNRVLVSIAVGWSSDRPVVRVLREDWFYMDRMIDDLALFMLSPLMVISYSSVGYLGVLLFYAPIRINYESQRRYAELRGAHQAMIRMERAAARGEAAGEVGHELRGQLVPISGRAQMLIRDAERGIFTKVLHHAQIILDQANRMRTMAEDLMETRKATLTLEKVDVNVLVENTVEIVRSQESFDGVEFDLRLQAGLAELRADRELLRETLMNLFLNAAQAMQKGTPAKRITVVTEFDRPGRSIRVEVTDTGPGIPPHVKDRIFERHFTTKDEGHGFGLAKAQRVIAMHGGEIVAQSPPGSGAQFVITLPLTGPSAGATAAAA